MSASIDDLLSFGGESAGEPERPSGAGRAGRLLRTAAVTAAVVVVIVAGFRGVGLRVPVWIIAAGVLAVLAVRRVTAALSPPPPPRAGSRSPAGEEPGSWNWSAQDAVLTAINGWERPLDWCADNPQRFTERVLPRLGELADERLRQRHGVTRESDPGRARALLGEPLWTFLDTPARRPPSPRDLAAIVAELEKI
ncbi:hypothetical protein [Micromonospora sp. DT31]|uniref:hypothetical protein n=1 Tax=Micromonospora sp. DT31 TaxID=3393434 RepID=UPI003CEDB047